MNLYKIELDKNTTYYGFTNKKIVKTSWAHRHCLNNYFCNCSLYQYMRKSNISEFNLELIEGNIHPSVIRNKLKIIREENNSILNECRADMILSKKTWLKNTSVCCTCDDLIKEDFSNDEPYLLTFD